MVELVEKKSLGYLENFADLKRALPELKIYFNEVENSGISKEFFEYILNEMTNAADEIDINELYKFIYYKFYDIIEKLLF